MRTLLLSLSFVVAVATAAAAGEPQREPTSRPTDEAVQSATADTAQSSRMHRLVAALQRLRLHPGHDVGLMSGVSLSLRPGGH
jgi:hypothetical protein